MIRRAGMARSWPHVAGLALALAGCRTEIQLDGRDAAPAPPDVTTPRDAHAPDARDVGAPLDAPPDAADDSGGDAGPPPRVCEGPGLPLGAIAMTSPALAPSLVAIGTGTSARTVILVPPSASAVATTRARLLVLDREASVLADRELEVPTGGAAIVRRVGSSLAPGEAAMDLVLGERAQPIDALGADVGAPRPLPEPLDVQRQAATELVSDEQLVYVGASGRLVSLDVTTGDATVTSVTLMPADRLFVGRGSLVVNRPEPTLETWELALALDGTETVHVSFPGAEHAGRVLGAAWFAGERRWVAKGDGEFRAPTHVFRVGDDGSFASLTEQLLVGPLEPTQRDGLVAVATSDGRIVAIDTGAATFTTLLPAATHRLAAIARAEGELLVLTLEPGDPDARLVLHCGL